MHPPQNIKRTEVNAANELGPQVSKEGLRECCYYCLYFISRSHGRNRTLYWAYNNIYWS